MWPREGCRELERQRVKCVRGSEKQGGGEREKHVTELEMEGLRGKAGERPGHGELWGRALGSRQMKGPVWLATLTAHMQALTYSQAGPCIARFPPPPPPLPTDPAGAHPNVKHRPLTLKSEQWCGRQQQGWGLPPS